MTERKRDVECESALSRLEVLRHFEFSKRRSGNMAHTQPFSELDNDCFAESSPVILIQLSYQLAFKPLNLTVTIFISLIECNGGTVQDLFF